MGEYVTKEEHRQVERRVTKLEWMLDVLADKLDSILRVLVRIAWLLATPIVLGIGYAAIRAANKALPF